MNRFFTLLLAASCLTAVGQVPEYVPTDGLVAWYPFSGNADNQWSDNLHGEMVGVTPSDDRFGVVGNSFFFDGSGDGVFINHDAVFLSDQQTICLWLQIDEEHFDTASGLGYRMGVLNKTEPDVINTKNRYFAVSLSSEEEPSIQPLSFDVHASTGEIYGVRSVASATSPPMAFAQDWYFVCGVFEEDSLFTYVNGDLVASGSLQSAREENSAQIKIGRDYNFATNRDFHGHIDDIGFWNRALESQEILDLYLAPPPVMGCMDEEACNFDPNATLDDESCLYLDACGECGGDGTSGCTDSCACNFDAEAACHDGSCVYAPSIDLGEDIVSCEELVVLEAQDGQFFQWSTGESNPIIEVSQTGLYAVEASSQIGEPNVISGHTFIGRLGQSDYYISEASISWEDARTQSESLGGHLAVITSPEENELVWQGVYGNGLNPGGTNNYQAWIGLYQDVESPDYSEPNGGWRWVTDEAVSYLNWAANRPGNLDEGYFVHMTDANGNCPEGDIACGTWDDSGISANLQSAFYVLEVESPYGSCTSSDSIFVEFDHGSCFCGPGTIWDAEMQMCIGDGSGDINLDGCVQLNDLLDLLSAYGDCGAEESAWQCGDPLEYQGYDYETVQIGEQCWFVENLRAENYRNGDSIPSSVSNSVWQETDEGSVSVFGESMDCEEWAPFIDACDPSVSLGTYGRLYNWYAVNDDRGLCASGWHVPSDAEWISLELGLGMLPEESILTDDYRGMDQGIQMKLYDGWDASETAGANSSNFSGLPGGYRSVSGLFWDAGRNGYFWSATIQGTDQAYFRNLTYDRAGVYRAATNAEYGFSIRCIKDAE